MDVRSPAEWVAVAADADPGAPALAFADGMVTYVQLADQIRRRSASLRREWSDGPDGRGSIIPTPVRLDMPSIVELLALQSLGFVPAPFVEPAGAEYR
jgi:hypothetical protein